MDSEDYETLPTTSVAINMLAGSIAGVLEFGLMYPLDSVRTRMQSFSPHAGESGIYSTFKQMIKTEGLLRPVRGLSVVIAGTIPAHGLYFSCYEFSKEQLTKITKRNNLNYIASAGIATVVHDAVVNPTDVIKQRLQMYDSPYKTVRSCAVGVFKTEGLIAFYRSFGAQILMNFPFQAIHFVTYEFFQNLMNPERKYNAFVHIVAGGAAGGAGAAITTPLDVVRTLLNTQETGLVRGISDASKQISEKAGLPGFFKGITARVLYTMPGTAICWSTYEFFKFLLSGQSIEYKSSVSGKSALRPKDSTKDK